MAKTGLFVVSNPTKISRYLPLIRNHVRKTLYVQLCLDFQDMCSYDFGNSGKTVLGIYSQTNALCQNLDVRVLLSPLKYPNHMVVDTKKMIDVIFFDRCYSCEETKIYVKSRLRNTAPACEVMLLSGSIGGRTNVADCEALSQTKYSRKEPLKLYDNVVLGGTFDRLHTGHKILLSKAVLHCSKRLTVGVTDTPMLQSKKLWELIEPCSKRMDSVEEFLSDIEPSLEYNVVPIVDPFGPTKDDPELQMIVVSSETMKGGLKVNDVRLQNGLSKLEILVVDLLESNFMHSEEEESKVSSSNFRMRLLGTRLREPVVNQNLARRPYIIGLTGNVASGKTTIGKLLAEKGAGIINCDFLAHKLYRKGQAYHNLLVEHYGSLILNPDGEINRKVLGNLVFSKKDELEKLNNLLWPAIMDAAKTEIQQLYEKGHEVIILEAAVLLQAGWDQFCHEIWTTIIPPDLAVKRLQSRNDLSVTEAEARLAAQFANIELVNKSHVVFCTAWETSFTSQQVDKAWCMLQEFLLSGGTPEEKD